MSSDSRYMVPKLYYYMTPLFILLDYFGGISVRAAVLDSTPLYKNLYYGFCVLCAFGIYFRPGLSAVVALFESMIIVLMTVLSVFLPYVKYIMEADVLNTNLDYTNAFSIPRIVNIVLSGAIGILAFHGSLRMLGTPEGRPHSNTTGI